VATFLLKILNPKKVVYDGQVQNVFFPGDSGEFELMAYHAPIVSLLKEGEIVIDWNTHIPIKKGMVRFLGDECVVLLEQEGGRVKRDRGTGEAEEPH
jgi:F-type H+-transporting ATPase subunit epsilon